MVRDAEQAQAQARDFAEDYADFTANLRIADLAPEVVEGAKTNLFDTLACAIAGRNAIGVQELARVLRDWGGKPEATVWGSGDRLPAHHAAWLNGMMSHARDFDDTHDAAVLHAGVSVIPAAIAAAEMTPGATGADLIAGVVAGLELICRMGVAATVGPIEAGWIYTALLGHFSATAAAARVAGLDAAQTVNALGIALSQTAGTHQVTRDAAWMKRMQPGLSAKTGIVSVKLTQAGIRGAQKSFEGIDGFFRIYLANRYDAGALREGLGRRFHFLDLSYKPYPCCRYNHTAIDTALALRDRLGPSGTAGIRRITARVNAMCNEAVGTPIEIRRAPATVVQAQFSIPYTVGVALAKGAVGIPDFTDEGILTPEARRLAALTDVVVDAQIERDWGRGISPTHLIVETADGTIEARADLPRGNSSAPMSRADFERKMEGCLAASGLAWPAGTVAAFRKRIDMLDAAPRGASVVEALVP